MSSQRTGPSSALPKHARRGVDDTCSPHTLPSVPCSAQQAVHTPPRSFLRNQRPLCAYRRVAPAAVTNMPHPLRTLSSVSCRA